MRILHLDPNHPILIKQLTALGCANEKAYTVPKETIAENMANYDGIIIRSRFALDSEFLQKATQLKFIGRVGAGLENIDLEQAKKQGIKVFNAPEGNRNAVGEHTLGMLLALLNKLKKADQEVRNGIWKREENRGHELDGKTIGLIGYGNMGKAFAKKLRGFDLTVLCYDIKPNVGNQDARQAPISRLFKEADIVSLHTPETPMTVGMVNSSFIDKFQKPFWLLNTARGKSVITKDLITALDQGSILGAGLDVLEYEKTSFENLFLTQNKIPPALEALLKSEKVILSPHVAGWTLESKEKLAQTIVEKIKTTFTL